MNRAVLQRTADQVSEYEFSGTCRGSGRLLLTVRQEDRIIADLNRTPAGSALHGKVKGILRGIPVGGPYTLLLEIENTREKAEFKDILVGDLWLLAGQSNMADSGFMPSLTPESVMVRGFYMDNRWDIARDPLHNILYAAAPVHGGNPANPVVRPLRGTGPGTAFGLAMYEMEKVPQGLIACAHGGTSLSQWDPALRKQGGRSLYGALYERFRMLGGRVAGVLWYQGCNETDSEKTAEAYEKATRRLFAALRRDCGNPDLPIVFAQLGPYSPGPHNHSSARNWLTVRCAQYRMGQTLKNSVCVPTIDLELDDLIHLSNRSVPVLGRRMAQAMRSLRCPGSGAPQIAFKSTVCIPDPVTMNGKIRVKFKNVQGKLCSPGPACGFGIADQSGNLLCEAVNTVLAGDEAVVQTQIPYSMFSHGQYRIVYGGSLQPHANITDEAGRSLPCFLGLIRGQHRNMTAMMTHALISEAIYGDDRFNALTLPGNLADLKFQPAKFSSFFLACPREEGDLDAKPKIYCYKFRILLPEAMRLQMSFGADAAFALYCDGKEIDRHCTTNPVVPDEFKIPLKLNAGEHDFVCVFSSNSGHGWGICCRFFRTDGKLLPEFAELG